jgi:lysophospholipase L1-like esterase
MLRKVTFLKVCILVLSLASLTPVRAATQDVGGDFFLRNGDVYVIYGDSITDNCVYPRMIENYVLTRFPSWNVTFYNLGWSGDVARNIFRLQRDVLPIKPTVFTENMGMNDGAYSAINANTIKLYTDAYHTMIPMLRQCNPKMRIALISAVPFENQPGKYAADGAYPQTLQYLAKVKSQLAAEYNVPYIDLFTAYAKRIGYGKILYPDFILAGDGIHPNPVGQTIMGMLILKGMNAPSLIATLQFDVKDSTVKNIRAYRCEVKDAKASLDGIVSFDRLSEALPCPIEPEGEQAQRFLGVVNFADEINRDMLKIAGLTGKAYELKINGVSIGIYLADELAQGVNIAEPMKGPLWDQARAVAQATLERQAAHYTKWRNVWLKDYANITQGEYDLSNKARIALLDTQAQAAIIKQHELNHPRWVNFTLTPVAEKPVMLPAPVMISNSAALQPPRMETLDWTKKDVRMVDLRPVVNRSFADEIAGDGKGGLTDQGIKQNLGAIPVGRQVFSGVPFEIVDPAKNSDKSMVVISTRFEQKLNSAVVIPFCHKASVINFLHTGAWMPSSEKPVTVELNYSGGIKIKTQLAPGYHFADWWNPPKTLPAGVIAWRGESDKNPIGIMYTPFVNPRPELPIESITISLQEGSSSIYGLLAISYLE